MLEHRVLVYRSSDEFLATIVPFLREGIERSHSILVVSDPQCVKSTRGSLEGDGKHIRFEDAAKWYSSPRETLGRYREFIDTCLEGGSKWVRIVGEPVWQDRSGAEMREWKRYEAIIKPAAASAPPPTGCPYNAPSRPPSIL